MWLKPTPTEVDFLSILGNKIRLISQFIELLIKGSPKRGGKSSAESGLGIHQRGFSPVISIKKPPSDFRREAIPKTDFKVRIKSIFSMKMAGSTPFLKSQTDPKYNKKPGF